MSFIKQYKDRLTKRFTTFDVAFDMAVQNNIKTIVETGTARKAGNWEGDGLSTALFGEYCLKHKAKLWTCDISQDSMNISIKITSEYKDNITYVVDNSLNFLKSVDFKIDFLYLDSFDSNPGFIQQAQDHNLAEFKIVEDKLSNNCIVMIDDYFSGDSKQGKGAKTVPYMLSKGFKLVLGTYQALLIKNNNNWI